MIRLRIRCYLQKLVLENLILHPVLTKKNLLSLSKNMIYDLRCSFRGIEMYLEQALKNAMTRVDSCIQVLGLKIAQKIHSLPNLKESPSVLFGFPTVKQTMPYNIFFDFSDFWNSCANKWMNWNLIPGHYYLLNRGMCLKFQFTVLSSSDNYKYSYICN